MIWVENDRSDDNEADGVLWTLDEFDPEGNYTRRIVIKAPGDPEEDGIIIQGDKLFVVRGLAAAQATLDDDEEEEEEEDEMIDPLSVVCYKIEG